MCLINTFINQPETNREHIARLAQEREEENRIFRDWLNRKDGDEVDSIVNRLNEEMKPDPNNKNVKDSDKNRDSNTPYKDLPTVKDLPGNPFGDPNGWSDMAKDGDPWATAVLGALNGMKVGAYAGQGKAATYKFQLVVCADGSVDRIKVTQPSGDTQLDGALKTAIESLKLPKAPPDIDKQLAGKCKRIPCDFTWSGKGQAGKVK